MPTSAVIASTCSRPTFIIFINFGSPEMCNDLTNCYPAHLPKYVILLSNSPIRDLNHVQPAIWSDLHWLLSCVYLLGTSHPPISSSIKNESY